jgi:hypothetical protein
MTNLMHKLFKYTYYNPLHVHVSSNILLILRRSNCVNTASGIITVSKWPPVLCIGRSLTDSDDTRCCISTIWPHEDEQDVARNMKRIVINVFKKFVHQVGHWLKILNVQGEHKLFPWLQTFITRKLRGIQTGTHVEVYYCVVYNNNNKKNLELSYMLNKYFCIPRRFLVINVSNQENNLCSPCTFGPDNF